MKTKSYVRFLNRAAHFDADIELVDIVKIAITNGALNRNNGQYLFDHINAQQHPRLAARDNNNGTRRQAVAHLKATLYSSFIKDIYEDVTQYFREVLESAAKNGINPGRLIGACKISIDANSLLQAGNWNSVVHIVSQDIFRQLENKKSTKLLISEMNTRLNLGVAQATIDAALPYLEIRHLLVHADGKADQAFCNSYPNFGAVLGQKILLDHPAIQNARARIFALVEEFDQKIIANNVIAATELQP